MTDADLTALWSAWLKDRAQIHKMINLTSAMFRAHAEAVAAAARRSPPGRVERAGRVESWEDGRGPNSNVPNGVVRVCSEADIYPPQIAPPAPGGVTVATVPANKAMRSACKPRPELDRLIERARGHVMTDAEIQAQRESWVRGQVGMGDDADEAKARQAMRPEAAFGAPMTVYGSAGPYVATNPEDDGA
jgi:hypothetical protein